MQTATLALLSATTVGTLGTIVALPVDQARATTMLQKARRRVRRAQRKAAALDSGNVSRTTSGSGAEQTASGTGAGVSSLSLSSSKSMAMGKSKQGSERTRSACTSSEMSRSSTSTCSDSTALPTPPDTPSSYYTDFSPADVQAYEDDSSCIPYPSLASLSPSQRTPHKARPSIAITCPDGYFHALDLSPRTATTISAGPTSASASSALGRSSECCSPSSLMSPKGRLGMCLRGLSLGEAVTIGIRR